MEWKLKGLIFIIEVDTTTCAFCHRISPLNYRKIILKSRTTYVIVNVESKVPNPPCKYNHETGTPSNHSWTPSISHNIKHCVPQKPACKLKKKKHNQDTNVQTLIWTHWFIMSVESTCVEWSPCVSDGYKYFLSNQSIYLSIARKIDIGIE